MKNDLLLLSNSTLHGHGFLEHALDAIDDFLGDDRQLHFVPFALADHDGYTRTVREALRPLDIDVVGLHETANIRHSLEEGRALFVGGGNTFRLLKTLQRLETLELVRRRVRDGHLRYMGSSAGTNLACPTIRNTNDMPIVEPDGFGAFHLVPFQINTHYQDPVEGSTHMGETREQRIREFLEENDVPVLAIREGGWLRRRDERLTLHGTTGALLFRRGQEPAPLAEGADLSHLLDTQPAFDRQVTARDDPRLPHA